jgi:hypothetical protein
VRALRCFSQRAAFSKSSIRQASIGNINLGKSRASHKKRLDKLRAARRAARIVAKQQHLIVANIPNRELTDRLTIVLAQDGVPRKMAALFFRKRAADLYVVTPYLGVDEYACGIFEGVGGQETYTDTGRGVATSRRQVKLSYHESGQVHVRVQERDAEHLLARVQAPPIANLRGNHIFTLELEGTEHFDVAKEAELRKPSTVGISLPERSWRIKITGYAGQSLEQVQGKYGAGTVPTIGVRFVRETLPRPLFLGLYIIAAPPLQQQNNREPMQIVVAGFEDIPGGGGRAVFVHGRRLAAQ